MAGFNLEIGSGDELIVFLTGEQNGRTFRGHHFEDQLEKAILQIITVANPVYLGTDPDQGAKNNFVGSTEVFLVVVRRGRKADLLPGAGIVPGGPTIRVVEINQHRTANLQTVHVIQDPLAAGGNLVSLDNRPIGAVEILQHHISILEPNAAVPGRNEVVFQTRLIGWVPSESEFFLRNRKHPSPHRT